MRKGRKRPPRAAQQRLAMAKELQRRMVELWIAEYLHVTLTILKTQFGFDENQLAEFTRSLRESTTTKETEASPSAE